jgi:maltose O-acetyltransferase
MESGRPEEQERSPGTAARIVHVPEVEAVSVKTERDRMLAGEDYDPLDPELDAARRKARELCWRLNQSHEDDKVTRSDILAELFGKATDAWIQPPFYCDYGSNIALGRKVFFNFNCVVLDVAPVSIGDHVLFGPAVQIYTAMHPLDAARRRGGLESGKPVVIGADVWVGGGAIVCPGVEIGARSIIGAGSVVTRNIRADVFAAGNPCRVIRSLLQS